MKLLCWSSITIKNNVIKFCGRSNVIVVGIHRSQDGQCRSIIKPIKKYTNNQPLGSIRWQFGSGYFGLNVRIQRTGYDISKTGSYGTFLNLYKTKTEYLIYLENKLRIVLFPGRIRTRFSVRSELWQISTRIQSILTRLQAILQKILLSSKG